MGFNNVNGLWLLLAVPVVVLFYLYKEKSKREYFPSLFIWNKLEEKITVKKRAFNRLLKKLLLFLQLIAVCLFSLYVSEPYIKNNYNYDNVIIIADCSISMKTKSGDNKSLLDYEKSAVNELIGSLNNECLITVIRSGKNTEILSDKKGKAEALKAVSRLEGEYADYGTQEALSLAEKLSDSNTRIYLYSGRKNTLADDRVKSFFIGGNEENTGVVSVFGDYDKKTIKAEIKNYSDKSVKRTVLLYGENALIDSREVEIEPASVLSVNFENIKNDYDFYRVEIKESESLTADNTRFLVLNNQAQARLAYLGEENYYIRRVVNAAYKGKLYRGYEYEDFSGEVFDTYIFNENIPQELPENGNIIIINPKNNCDIFEINSSEKGEKIKTQGAKDFEYFKNIEFDVSEVTTLKNISSQYNYYAVCLSGNTPVIYAGEENGRKIIVFAFDLSKSDLIYRSDFPALFSNIFSDLSDMGVTEKNNNLWGDYIRLNSWSYTEAVKPDGNKINISDRSFYADEIGIYAVEDKNAKRLFAVNPDLRESELLAQASEKGGNDTVYLSGKNLSFIIFVLLTALVLLEWLVYNNDN